MKSTTKLLRDCIHASVQVFQLDPYEFKSSVGLGDFLLDIDNAESSPEEIAEAIFTGMIEPQLRTVDCVLCVALVMFLDRSIGEPSETTKVGRIADLKTLVQQQTTPESFRGWVKSQYY